MELLDVSHVMNYAANEIKDLVKELISMYNILLHLVKSHVGTVGNEIAINLLSWDIKTIVQCYTTGQVSGLAYPT